MPTIHEFHMPRTKEEAVALIEHLTAAFEKRQSSPSAPSSDPERDMLAMELVPCLVPSHNTEQKAPSSNQLRMAAVGAYLLADYMIELRSRPE